jgi:hypothetical protein
MSHYAQQSLHNLYDQIDKDSTEERKAQCKLTYELNEAIALPLKKKLSH